MNTRLISGIKGVLCSFGEERRKVFTNGFFLMSQFHTVLLCLYVADPATFLSSNSILRTLFCSENSLFIHLRKRVRISPSNSEVECQHPVLFQRFHSKRSIFLHVPSSEVSQGKAEARCTACFIQYVKGTRWHERRLSWNLSFLRQRQCDTFIKELRAG